MIVRSFDGTCVRTALLAILLDTLYLLEPGRRVSRLHATMTEL
jgi:hypothetical protein